VPDIKRLYTSMGASDFRQGLPEVFRQFPIWNPKPDPHYALIKPEELQAMLKQVDTATAAAIQKDYEYLDNELMPMFRDRDFRAKEEQNRYRKYQLYFMGLAASATFIGSLQVIVIDRANWVSFFAFLEMFVALLTTYVATVQGNESPLQRWLLHRRRAESLRREYFRYLANVEPYDTMTPAQRRRLLSNRAADINRGVYLDELEQG
jgi:hypothetical protein